MKAENTHVRSLPPLARWLTCLAALAWGTIAASAGQIYGDPPGGWAYIFQGDTAQAGSGGFTALDGAWSHDNGSDAWDGSGLGAGVPGGIGVLSEGSTTFIRIQDPGDPRDHGRSDPSNRKIYLARSLAAEGVPANFLDAGVTLTFRARVATSPPLDPQYPDTDAAAATQGENRTTAGGTAWQAAGNGNIGANDGKGNFTIRQQATDAQISFSLTLSTDWRGDGTPFGTTGLTMNSRSGAAPSGTVDPWNNEGTNNVLPMASLTDGFHEFWITIQADTSGGGTHRVEIYVDGSLSPQVFHVTAGTGEDGENSAYNFIAMGSSATQQQCAYDVDFFAYKVGLHLPQTGTGAPGFLQHPVSVITNEGVLVQFSVVATGAPPRTLQWQRDSGGGFTNIPGASSERYALGPVVPPDSGSAFRCVASNGFGDATSTEATLTVLADTNPPTIVKVVGDPTMANVWVYFSERIRWEEPASDPWNYQLSPFVQVNSAALDATGTRMLLTTAGLTPGTTYTLTVVDAIADYAYTPNFIPGGTTASFRAWVGSPGFLFGEHYLGVGIGDATIPGLTNDARYPNWSDTNFYVNSSQTLQTAPNIDNYGGRLTGWVVPPVDGAYTFFIRGDDGTQLKLSGDDNPANRQVLVTTTGANNPFDCGTCTPQNLVAGQKYSLEILWKEASGGDYVQVGWTTPFDATTNFIPCAALGTYANPDGAALSITNPPQNQTNTENRTATFTVGVSVTPSNNPACYRWQRKDDLGVFTNIWGAFGPTFTTHLLKYPDDNNATYRVVVGAPGADQVPSEPVILTVLPDGTPPTVLSARRAFPENQVVVTFDELMDPNSAADGWNYWITNATAGVIYQSGDFSSVTLGADSKTVTIVTTFPLTNGAIYRLMVRGVTDVSQNALYGTFPITLIGARVPVGTQRIVSMEAENADAVVPRVWEGVLRNWDFTTQRAGYSGTGAMRAMPNTEGNRPGGAEGCSLDFYVSFPTGDAYPRTYYLWVRGAAEGGADNSIHGGLDGAVPASANNMQPGYDLGLTGWHWGSVLNDGSTRATLLVPSAGLHNVQVFMREDGFYSDKVVLTVDSGYNPGNVNNGLGPDETGRETTVPTIALNIARAGGNVTLTWNAGGLLQQADEVTGPWTTLEDAVSGYTVAADLARRFYRVLAQ